MAVSFSYKVSSQTYIVVANTYLQRSALAAPTLMARVATTLVSAASHAAMDTVLPALVSVLRTVARLLLRPTLATTAAHCLVKVTDTRVYAATLAATAIVPTLLVADAEKLCI